MDVLLIIIIISIVGLIIIACIYGKDDEVSEIKPEPKTNINNKDLVKEKAIHVSDSMQQVIDATNQYNPCHKELQELMHKYFMGMCADANWQLSIQDFAITSISLINFLTMINKLSVNQRKEAALSLCKEYNMGCNNSMSDSFLDGLAEEIVKNKSLDMDRIKLIIDNIDNVY